MPDTHGPAHVVMVIARFFPVEGGSEIQCRRLCRALGRTGISSLVLTQRLPGLAGRTTVDDIPVRRVGLPFGGFIGSASFFCAGLWWLFRRARRSVIHAHLAGAPALIAAAGTLLWGAPSLVKIGGSRSTGDVGTSRHRWYGMIKLRVITRAARCCVCPSRETRDELVAAGIPSVRTRIIPNGVDVDAFAPPSMDERSAARGALGISDGERVALYAGRLEQGKGLEVLLEAWRDTAAGVPDARLIVTGAGPMEARLRAQAKHIPGVIFTGARSDVRAVLHATDVFVLPSRGEGLSNALLEAMACARAIVATDIGGTTDAVSDGISALLIPPGNSAALAQALIRVLNDAVFAATLGGSARRRAVDGFALPAVAREYTGLYGELGGPS